MNKKVLVIAIALMAVAMLATPMFGMVQAGKGQERLDFLLHLEGLPGQTWDRRWEAGETVHYRGRNWVILGDFYVKIGEGGAVETITKPYLSYDCSMDANRNYLAGFYVLKAIETISIYGSDTVHDETTLRGTLELLSLSDNPGGSGANFVGFGTGEFEGVKIQGTSASSISGYMLVLDREGTVMGWPT